MANHKVETDSRWIFIPVEVKVRELLAKTLLACLAAERGFKVILGEAHAVRDCLHMLPAGILMEKGVAPPEQEKFSRFIKQGNKIVSWCEEGLVFFDDDDYVRRKVSHEDLTKVECFFAWGKYQADVINSRFSDIADRMVLSGNPRFDLLRPEYRGFFQPEVDRLRNQYGKYILINSNFQHCNHKKGEGAYVGMLKLLGRIATDQAESFALGWMQHKQTLFDAFIPMVRAIRKSFPDYQIIIRPHPGENHETWRDLFHDDSRIVVVHEGGVIPWVIASSVLIHNGCTTGIEAALLDHPSIAYQPMTSETYDQHLPNSVNFAANSEDTLLDALDLLLNKENIEPFVGNPKWKDTLSQFVSGVSGDSSCETILNTIESMSLDIKATNRRPWFPLHRFDLKKYVSLISWINDTLSGGGDRGEYSEQKFSGLTADALERDITQLHKICGKFDSVTVDELKENVFLLSSVDTID